MKKFLFLIAFVPFFAQVVAQGKPAQSKPAQNKQEQTKAASAKPVADKAENAAKDASAADDDVVILDNSMTDCYEINQENGRLKKEIEALKKEIERQRADSTALRAELQTMASRMGKVDEMTIQMITTYMHVRCAAPRVKKMKDDFDAIVDQKLKDQNNKLYRLLFVYVDTYNAVRDVVKSAAAQIPTASEAERAKIIDGGLATISQLKYVKEFLYNEVNSPYLNNMISEAKQLLTTTSKDEDFRTFLIVHP